MIKQGILIKVLYINYIAFAIGSFFCKRCWPSGGSSVPRSRCEMSPESDEDELAQLPPDSKCWDWPLSRHGRAGEFLGQGFCVRSLATRKQC